MNAETQLLLRLRAGDAQAFEVLVRQYNARMLAVAHRFLQHPDDCADAVQDTKIRLHLARQGLRASLDPVAILPT